MHLNMPTMVLVSSSLIHQTQSFLLHRPPGVTRHASFMLCATKTTTTCTSKETRRNATFLQQVEESIRKVQAKPNNQMINLQNIPHSERESVGVANRLSNRLHSLHKNNDCPKCWLQRAHCICTRTPPIEHLIPQNINRLFMIMHHKEIAMVVDTAKLLLNSMPNRARLVVSGITKEYQESVGELNDALAQKERKCIVLFPTDDAIPFLELYHENENEDESKNYHANIDTSSEGGILKKSRYGAEYDVIVMDGTWQQAQKIHQKYIPLEKDGGPQRVCLSQESLDILGNTATNPTGSHVVHGVEKGGNGRQLRRHPIKWKEVSTLEATRLLFRDMMVAMDDIGPDAYMNEEGKQCHDLLAEYQRISDEAAVKQLGPPRKKMEKM